MNLPSPKRTLIVLATLSVFLAATGLTLEAAYYARPHPNASLRPAVAFFSLSYEENLPTWFSASLLLTCALLLTLITNRNKPEPNRREAAKSPVNRQLSTVNTPHASTAPWTALAAIFLILSLDEAAQLHENLAAVTEGRGLFFFSWVIPAAVIVLLIGIAYARFLWALPRRRRAQFVTAAALYIGGALVMELPLGWWTEKAGNDNFTYAAIDHVEELLEMLGASAFIAALLEELAEAEPAA